MATYKGIQGYTVQKLSADPSPAENILGQLFYNSSTGKFKLSTEGAGAWAAGTAFNTGRANLGVAGTTTAAVIFGGDTGGPARAEVEMWNGTSWTEVVNLPQGVFMATGLGTNTAALSVGGTPIPSNGVNCNKWDGTSWASTGALTTASSAMGAAGTQTAGIKFGGEGSGYRADVETFDGSTWTEVANLNTGRKQGAAATKGTTTSTLYAGGEPGYTAISETWNGTSWTEGSNLNQGRSGTTGCGIVTSAMAFGGQQPGEFLADTETYDGTSWATAADLATAITNNSGIGSNATAALNCGGTPTPPVYTNAVEEWSDPVYTNKTVTVS